jgi:hypothetical protein
MSGTAKLNVGGELNDVVFTLAPAEHSEDRNARIARENRRARNDEFLRLTTYAIAAFAVTVIGTLSVYTIFLNTEAAAETRTYAIDTLKMLTPAVIAFILGRATSAK